MTKIKMALLSRIKLNPFKVPVIRTSSKFFFAFFTHGLIELQLLIAKNQILTLTDAVFRSKKPKLERYRFSQKPHGLSAGIALTFCQLSISISPK
jgi:hypothetical protein